jgi:hypothetical protein
LDFFFMSARKYSPHQILYIRAPYALGVCLFFFTLTLFIAPFSLPCLGIALAVGLIASVISADELTGGKALSWLHVPLLVGGGYVAQIVAVGDSPRTEWALILQYISLAFAVDLAVIILFRSKIMSFRQRKATK